MADRSFLREAAAETSLKFVAAEPPSLIEPEQIVKTVVPVGHTEVVMNEEGVPIQPPMPKHTSNTKQNSTR